MFSTLRSFLYRHRRKFIFTGIVASGALLLTRYFRKTYIEWQTRETHELITRLKKQQHFEHLEKTCDQTAITFGQNLRDSVLREIETENLIASLKLPNSNKLEIFDELKILAFAKITTLVYGSSLLMTFLRLQLSLLGGYMLRVKMGETNLMSSTVQEKYMALCQFLLEDGVKRLSHLVQDKVRLIMMGRSLKEEMTLHDVEQVFWAIQSAIGRDSRNPCNCLSHYLLPAASKFDGLSRPEVDQFNRVMLETRDLLESPEISTHIASCISRGFSVVMDRVAEFYVPKHISADPQPGPSSRIDSFFASNIPPEDFPNVTKAKIPLAKVIPIVNDLSSHVGAKNDIMQSLMQLMILSENLKLLSANVYEAFCTP